MSIYPAVSRLPTSLVAQTVKHLPTMRETRGQSLGWEDLLEKEMATHSRFLPGKSHGQRNLEGYSPRGHKESDTTAISLSRLPCLACVEVMPACVISHFSHVQLYVTLWTVAHQALRPVRGSTLTETTHPGQAP